jgi:hypothetical protein
MTVEETLFASGKGKEKNAPSNYPNTPLKGESGQPVVACEWFTTYKYIREV